MNKKGTLKTNGKEIGWGWRIYNASLLLTVSVPASIKLSCVICRAQTGRKYVYMYISISAQRNMEGYYGNYILYGQAIRTQNTYKFYALQWTTLIPMMDSAILYYMVETGL